MSIPQAKVALYLDYENIPDVEFVRNCIDFARSLGRVVIQNAYTTQWKESRHAGNYLRELGFCLVNTIFKIKNSVDYKCMSDCLTAVQAKSSPDIFILVTGDGDYAQILNILKKDYKKQTIVFSRRGSESKRLMKIANEFYFTDENVA